MLLLDLFISTLATIRIGGYVFPTLVDRLRLYFISTLHYALSYQCSSNIIVQLALCFKCASDTIFLDDFKSVLDHIAESALRRVATAAYSGSKQGKSSAGKPGVSGTSFNRSTTGNNVGVSSEITGPGLKSPGASKRWIGSRLTGRRSEDSGENQLMEEDGHKQNQIIAETTITMTELTEDSRTGSSSGGDHGIQMVSMPRKADQQRFY